MSSSWKLDSSQTTAVSGPLDSATSVSGRPTFPATATSRPAARKIAPRSSVVVVFPFVPVTPTNWLPLSRRYPSSTSLQIGSARARAAAASGDSAGTPGLLTTSSIPSSSDSSTDPTRTSTPAALSLLASTSADRSAATTDTPRRASARAAACPDRASPSTSARRGNHAGVSVGPVPVMRRYSPQGEYEGPCRDDSRERRARPSRIRDERPTSSEAAGAEKEVWAAEGHRCAGEALQVRFDRGEVVLAERLPPALSRRRRRRGAAGVETRADRLVGHRPLLARVLERPLDRAEARTLEPRDKLVGIEPLQRVGGGERLPLCADPSAELAERRPVDGRREIGAAAIQRFP